MKNLEQFAEWYASHEGGFPFTSESGTRTQLSARGIITEYKAANTCEWIKYDYRTMCPKNHGDVDNPYWRIPTDMKHLRYCPYCGKRIRLVE